MSEVGGFHFRVHVGATLSIWDVERAEISSKMAGGDGAIGGTHAFMEINKCNGTSTFWLKLDCSIIMLHYYHL